MYRRTLTLTLLIPVTLIAVGQMAHARRAKPSEANKTAARAFVDEVFNQHNLTAIDRYIAPTYVEHQTAPGQSNDLAGFKQMIAMFLKAFPDFHFTIDDMIAEGDKVVVRATLTGTQKGEFMGIAPTGKRVSITSIDIVRLVDGKAVEHWGIEDDLGMMQQLGALPAPGQAPR
jgi:predicted ester cyclase